MAMFLAILVALFTAITLYKLLFDDIYDFGECIRFWFTPNIISWFRGELDRDWWAELKLIIWLGMTVLMGYGTYVKLSA